MSVLIIQTFTITSDAFISGIIPPDEIETSPRCQFVMTGHIFSAILLIRIESMLVLLLALRCKEVTESCTAGDMNPVPHTDPRTAYTMLQTKRGVSAHGRSTTVIPDAGFAAYAGLAGMWRCEISSLPFALSAASDDALLTIA